MHDSRGKKKMAFFLVGKSLIGGRVGGMGGDGRRDG